MTLKSLKERFIATLADTYPKQEAENMFFIALQQVSGMTKLDYLFESEQTARVQNAEKLAVILGELSSGKPLQYILGSQPFYGRVFATDPRVLIPRGETEELIALILGGHSGGPLRVLDIGTGSGCIAVTLKAERPAWKVEALDISEEALEVARLNAEKNSADVRFIQGDILQESFRDTLGQYDIIVSNPPYVRESEKTTMHRNVLDFEPSTAFFVEDSDPLIFYRETARFSQRHLAQKGFLYFEINQYLGAETCSLLHSLGLNRTEIFRDIPGAERMIRAFR